MNKNKKTRLGRGIESLFNKTINSSSNNNLIKDIDIKQIKTNPFQPRTRILKKELNQLITSIKTYGLIQPITIREKGVNSYELISGERRLQACKEIGLLKITAFIKSVKNNQMLEMALVENIQRQDLDPIEIALSFQQLTKQHNLNQDQISKKVGKQRSTISNYIRLLKLNPIIQAGLRDKIISMGHARALINIDNEDLQFDIYQDIIKYKYSVRETEFITKNQKQTPNTKKQINTKLTSNFKQLEEQLTVFFDQNVKLKVFKNGKGKIEIPFNSENKLNEIIKLLQS